MYNNRTVCTAVLHYCSAACLATIYFLLSTQHACGDPHGHARDGPLQARETHLKIGKRDHIIVNWTLAVITSVQDLVG